MMEKKTTQRPILSVLKAVSGDPDTFGTFLRHLTPADVEHAWLLAFELAAVDDIERNTCADLLSAWCTARLLESVR
jgi:hypothetical protein